MAVGLSDHEAIGPGTHYLHVERVLLPSIVIQSRMDDLSALDWSTGPENARNAKSYGIPSPAFAALRSTPLPGRASPGPQNPSNPPSKARTPTKDSFSNLVSFGSASTNKTLTLQEQQKRLLEQKERQQAAEQKQFQPRYIEDEEQFWNNLGSGRSTPASASQPPVSGAQFQNLTGEPDRYGTTNGSSKARTEDVFDILAAFDADTPVDSSTHFPKPIERSIAPSGAEQQSSSTLPKTTDTGNELSQKDLYEVHDDDPFGLAGLHKQRSGKPQGSASHDDEQNDDEDILGLLGRPISKLPNLPTMADPVSVSSERQPVHPQDQAMAELVEMGFAAERAREALEITESGVDVQRAVGWLLHKAHSESRQKVRARRSSNEGTRQSRDPKIDRKSGSRPTLRQSERSDPARTKDRPPQWKQPQRSPSSSNRLEKDPAQTTSELGNVLLKTAGSFWKNSARKVQQAVNEFNSDSDSSQPKWMKEPGTSRCNDHTTSEGDTARIGPRSSTKEKWESVTDEAMLLESDRACRLPRKPPKRQGPSLGPSADNSRDHSPAMSSRSRQEFPTQPVVLRQQQLGAQSRSDIKAALNRKVIDEQASQAYVSSARRPKSTPKAPASASEPDLLESASQPEPWPTNEAATNQPFQFDRPSHQSIPVALRPTAPSRRVPPVSPMSLKAFHADREAGNEQFKRGDYSAAHRSYTSSIKSLPANHPMTIILYTNRALTALKIGEPKTAILDAEAAITAIGPSRGEGEIVDLANGQLPKPMRDYFGKALMRKAEALEQMEKFKEAALVWKEAVEGNHGGAMSIQGKLRCENIVAPQQPKRSKPSMVKKPPSPAPIPSDVSYLSGTSTRTRSTVAVKKLRAANAAADRIDDERFALANTVDAKLVEWKGGKADNLRALLGSLDTVLWPGADWKKIGMAELVLPAKVKVLYIKGISKVHPDKVRRPYYYRSTATSWSRKKPLDQRRD